MNISHINSMNFQSIKISLFKRLMHRRPKNDYDRYESSANTIEENKPNDELTVYAVPTCQQGLIRGTKQPLFHRTRQYSEEEINNLIESGQLDEAVAASPNRISAFKVKEAVDKLEPAQVYSMFVTQKVVPENQDLLAVISYSLAHSPDYIDEAIEVMNEIDDAYQGIITGMDDPGICSKDEIKFEIIRTICNIQKKPQEAIKRFPKELYAVKYFCKYPEES